MAGPGGPAQPGPARDVLLARPWRPRGATASDNRVWVLAVVAVLFFLRRPGTARPDRPGASVTHSSHSSGGSSDTPSRDHWRTRCRIARVGLMAEALLAHRRCGGGDRIAARRRAARSPDRDDARRPKRWRGAAGGGGAREPARSARSASSAIAVDGSGVVERVVSAVFAAAGEAVVIIFLVLFLLLLRNRTRAGIIDVAGPNAERRRVTSQIIDDVEARFSSS